MKKANIIVPALLSIAACGGIIAGSTYALFTSEAKTNVAITSGKVNVTATLGDLEAYSPTSIEADGTLKDDTNIADNTAEEKVFANGGTAVLEGDTLKLSKVTPGDKATFTFKIHNDSNVKAIYRLVIGCEEDNGLFAGLNFNLDDADGIDFAQSLPGITTISKYVSIDPESADKTIKLSVELPTTAGNAYQGKECSVVCKVEAVQGNTVVEDQASGTLRLYSATDLVNYGKLEAACVNTSSTIAKYTTIELMNDVDMAGIDWTPIMARGNIQPTIYGTLIFDGKEHTISNLTASEAYDGFNYFSGFFGRLMNMTVQNLTIDNATISGTHYAGGIVGQALYSSNIINCKVTNSSIISVTEDKDGDGKYDNGDKVGGIVGQFNEGSNAKLEDCTVDKCEIKGYRHLGGLVGYASGNIAISNNKVSNTSVTSDKTHDYKDGDSTYATAEGYGVGKIVGQESGSITLTDNTATNVTVINTK